MMNSGRMMSVTTFGALAIGAALIAGLTSANGDAEPASATVVRDPVSGELADGTVRSLALLPGVIEFAGQGPITLFQITPTDDPQTTISPRLVVFRQSMVEHEARGMGHEVAAGETLESGVLKNPGPYSLEVQYLRGQELVTVDLAPGFGLFVGQDLSPIAATHTWGCRCKCVDSDGNHEYITVDCASEGPGQGTTTFPPDCHCDVYDAQIFTFDDDQNEGTTSECGLALIKNN